MTDKERALEAIAGFRQWMNWDAPEEHPDSLAAYETLSSGRCDDCQDGARIRKRIGRFSVCLDCLGKRLRAGIVAERTPEPT